MQPHYHTIKKDLAEENIVQEGRPGQNITASTMVAWEMRGHCQLAQRLAVLEMKAEELQTTWSSLSVMMNETSLIK